MTSMQSTASPALPGNLREKAIQVFPLVLGQRDIGPGQRLLNPSKRFIGQLASVRRHQSAGRGQNLKLQHCPECLIAARPAFQSPKEMKHRLVPDLGKTLPIAGFGNKMDFQPYAFRACFHIIHQTKPLTKTVNGTKYFRPSETF